jgi:hypothetical protein
VTPRDVLPLTQAATGQAGDASRFARRWRLAGAGLSNVWRFGDLELPAPSGRLLLRGPNGTGKTTALEALVPYLLDLNAARLSAGKARTTSLSSLMREGATGKRRLGHAWLTLAAPREGCWSYGVRLQYSEGASPQVRVQPFAVPGRPLHELALYGPGRAALSTEQFADAVQAKGGRVFESEDEYVAHLATRLLEMPDVRSVKAHFQLLREVRNPTLLGDVSPQAAADALRVSLPGVAEEIVVATADALAESDATREAFARDAEAATLLEEFSGTWRAHVADVVGKAHTGATEAADEDRSQLRRVKLCSVEMETARSNAAEAKRHVEQLEGELALAEAEVHALSEHDAYRAAGRLKDLQQTAAAKQQTAHQAAKAMDAVARRAASETDALERELRAVADDLDGAQTEAGDVDESAARVAIGLRFARRDRPPLRAGNVVADPGPELTVNVDVASLGAAAATWAELARVHAARADAAVVALAEHREVEAAHKSADEATRAAQRAEAEADRARTRAARAEADSREAARALHANLRSWIRQSSPRLEAFAAAAHVPSETASWNDDDLEGWHDAEPGRLLAAGDEWASQVTAQAAQVAAALGVRASTLAEEAGTLRADAAKLRADAAKLRAGDLLPLPRPAWAGPGEDAVALGAALDWRPGFDEPRARALIEASLAVAGLLGAALDREGARTAHWWVTPSGPIEQVNLSSALAVDPAHALAPVASAVLERIRLVPTADNDDEVEPDGALCIGRDGTFRTGVLRGRVPGAYDPVQLPSASHVGARRRREAALARAARLDEEAQALEDRAVENERLSASCVADAKAATALGAAFPPREALRGAEARRGELVKQAGEAQDASETARTAASLAQAELDRRRAAWVEHTQRRGLPSDLTELARLRDDGKRIAKTLEWTATRVQQLSKRLKSALDRHAQATKATDLVQAEAEAAAALRDATALDVAVRTLEETSGDQIKDVLARHEQASRRASELRGKLPGSRALHEELASQAAVARNRHESAQQRYRDETQPRADATRRSLRALLELPGVLAAVLGDEPLHEPRLLEQLERLLAGRRTLTTKTVFERADAVRARLAGVWSLDLRDDQAGLLQFQLTHRDESFTPMEAAIRAEKLRQRAEKALAASEEHALRDFVIGRLPNAIATAWVRLQDWVDEVNRKMRSAAASSGVGVQVRIPLRDDLPPAVQEVYQLSCKVSGAERSAEQQQRLGAALNGLIAASSDESMQERVASAVDIRDWVEVYYEVTRPGGNKQRWSSKIGLSGGERRLVVLAPMLAAIAAGCDRFGPRTLRLVTLDEVPVEVDDRGREGLARYLAELDLDLVCTSYLWDGCPGAWDGIDAYDLEAGSDGTVVAFPMLVRGLLPIDELDAVARTRHPEKPSDE